ncbi:ArsR/SmtB family transcription factor [Plantactinospora sp. WMMB334]|uniref:ArsR/SmtB family transcription factor n=1 Tax=Plantactinospora sp. WMMB334 TaxID=3404119 RepID=UPI003B937C23
MDGVFKALADGSRRRLLDSLNTRNGQSLRELCAGLEMTRQSVSKHLAVLEAANLVTTLWRGREKLHYLNAEPINAIADRWINQYDRARVHALADLKRALEQAPMAEREFVYTTFINTTPERLWQAITDPAFTSRYWGVIFETDWQPGSEMVWVANGARIADPAQVVLEAEPYRRLSFTWHSFTPEFAKAYEMDPAEVAKLAEEPRSRVSFEIEPRGGTVRLTVVHEGFAPDSPLLDSIGEGWSELLSSLKTLLETGEPLPQGGPERQDDPERQDEPEPAARPAAVAT